MFSTLQWEPWYVHYNTRISEHLIDFISQGVTCEIILFYNVLLFLQLVTHFILYRLGNTIASQSGGCGPRKQSSSEYSRPQDWLIIWVLKIFSKCKIKMPYYTTYPPWYCNFILWFNRAVNDLLWQGFVAISETVR